MCTVIVGFDPEASTPLVLAAVRDEMLDRAWLPPAAHWPDRPDLLGGRDVREGGTWLAARRAGPRTRSGRGGAGAPGAPCVAAVLNGLPPGSAVPGAGAAEAGGRLRSGRTASLTDTTVPPGTARYSRGRLPLAAAERGKLDLDSARARHYDPFHLLVADPDRAVLHSWDGSGLSEHPLAAGVTVLVNSGSDAQAPRARRHGPAFARTRPDPAADELAEAASAAAIWGRWPALLDEAAHGDARTAGFGERTDDPSSLIARSELGDGRVWATSSITLIACGRDTLRYAFTDRPGDPAAWYLVR
ncbi:NRDE family protein [Streptomonospora sp. PA3]|uniref:NRDE family protein n=1 Tax=Streptomonospora sp. PA3 TaxID=2607326 RepID=UPI0012DC5D32|nr:NRDE family protein [Streptomonospora sp. PA3]MUL43398.1 NRDE family protein [Streptomonospora sp. PA3]